MGPTYFSNAISRERIKHDIPDCKIIVTFREPAARLYSLYRLLRSERRPVHRYLRRILAPPDHLRRRSVQLRDPSQAMAGDVWKVAGAGAVL